MHLWPVGPRVLMLSSYIRERKGGACTKTNRYQGVSSFVLRLSRALRRRCGRRHHFLELHIQSDVGRGTSRNQTVRQSPIVGYPTSASRRRCILLDNILADIMILLLYHVAVNRVRVRVDTIYFTITCFPISSDTDDMLMLIHLRLVSVFSRSVSSTTTSTTEGWMIINITQEHTHTSWANFLSCTSYHSRFPALFVG